MCILPRGVVNILPQFPFFERIIIGEYYFIEQGLSFVVFV